MCDGERGKKGRKVRKGRRRRGRRGRKEKIEGGKRREGKEESSRDVGVKGRIFRNRGIEKRTNRVLGVDEDAVGVGGEVGRGSGGG